MRVLSRIQLTAEQGILRYRGYSIEDLADKANFLEVSYLLVFGELPTQDQLINFENDIRKYTLIHEEMKDIIDGFPKSAHPMGILASLTSALTAFNPRPVNVSSEKEIYNAVCKTLAKFLVLATWVHRKREGYPLSYYDNTKGYVENFLHLMFAIPTEPYKENPIIVDALHKLFILHADHEQNCHPLQCELLVHHMLVFLHQFLQEFLHYGGLLHGGANPSCN